MKWTTIKLSAPAVGRSGDNALELTVRENENFEDQLVLSNGDEDVANSTFFAAYAVKLQARFRGMLKSDGSTDETILSEAKTFVVEPGRAGGLNRAAAERRAIAKFRSQGKTTISLQELDAAIEEEIELALLEREEAAEAEAE